MDVSVLIPTKGRPKTLRRCLEHLGAQTNPPAFEVIVSIDGDDDYAEAGLDRAAGLLGFPLTAVRSRGRYQAAALNRALEEARGELVVILGDDIFIAADCLRRHVDRHRALADPKTAVQGKVSWHPELFPNPLLEWETKRGIQFAFDRMQKNSFVPLKFLYTCNLSIRRNWLRELGGFDGSLTCWVDTIFAFEAGKRGLKLFYDPEAWGYHHDAWTLERIGNRRYQKGRLAARFLEDPDFQKHVLIPLPGVWRTLRYRTSRAVRPLAMLTGWERLLGWCWIHEINHQFCRGLSEARKEEPS